MGEDWTMGGKEYLEICQPKQGFNGCKIRFVFVFCTVIVEAMGKMLKIATVLSFLFLACLVQVAAKFTF